MMVLDVCTNFDPESNIEAFKIFFADLESRRSLLFWLQAIEEGFKILSEGCFIAATIICLQIARQSYRIRPHFAKSDPIGLITPVPHSAGSSPYTSPADHA